MTMIMYLLFTLYVTVILLTLYGMYSKDTRVKNPSLPFVSIIVAARNEENYINNCLNSLQKIKYPADKLEYILINDRSDDRTGELIQQFSSQVDNCRTIDITHIPSHTTGKINALQKGTRAARGDLFLFTDADCEVPAHWVHSFLKYLDSETGMAGGFLVLDRKNKKSSLFAYLQSLDWILLSSLGYAWAHLGRPLSVFGNNFAITRKIYDKSGGFDSVADHLTEDYALMKNVHKHTQVKIRFILDPHNAVYTHPEPTVSAFFKQRKRWALSSTKRGILSLSLSSISLLTRLLIITTFFHHLFITGLLALALIILLDSVVLYKPLRTLKRLYLLKHIFLFELYFTFNQLLFLPVALFSKKVVWKSKKYSVQ